MPWVRFDQLCEDCQKRHRKTGKRGPRVKTDPAEIKRLRRAGGTIREIAEELGCSVPLVNLRLSE